MREYTLKMTIKYFTNITVNADSIKKAEQKAQEYGRKHGIKGLKVNAKIIQVSNIIELGVEAHSLASELGGVDEEKLDIIKSYLIRMHYSGKNNETLI